MKTTPYHKLVRDNIPQIIAAAGKACTYRTLTHAAYLDALDAKLGEEVAEYQASKSLEELADILEVLRAAAIARGHSPEALEAARAEKARVRGGFAKRILLMETRETDAPAAAHPSAAHEKGRDE